jgi:hypothetical protein
MTLTSRIQGVIRHPRLTFETLATSPAWVGAFAASVVVSGVCWAAVYMTETGRIRG